MANTTHNHTNYQARLDFIKDLLHNKFHLKDANIVPIHSRGSSEARLLSLSPRAPKSSSLRLTNSNAEGMNQKTRVENEVAIITLASNALNDFQPHVVPSIYGWGTAATTSSQGWILQELMPGAPLDEIIDSMGPQERANVFHQMAALLKALQSYKLPDHITFGGVTFDEDGRIVSTAMTSVGAGPWPTYEDSFKGRLEVALARADANPYIKGWHANGVRERLNAFVDRGVPAQFESLSSRQDRAIIHADFTANNILYDKSTKRITALIDFDFACILHPSYEFLRSFDGAGGQFRGWSGDEGSEQSVLRDAKIHGFPSLLPESTKDGIQWELVKSWEDGLEKFDVRRPRTIPGIDKVADVDTILRTILPWRVNNSDILKR